MHTIVCINVDKNLYLIIVSLGDQTLLQSREILIVEISLQFCRTVGVCRAICKYRWDDCSDLRPDS